MQPCGEITASLGGRPEIAQTIDIRRKNPSVEMIPTDDTLKVMYVNMAKMAAQEYDWQTVYDEIEYVQLSFTFGVAFLVLVFAWIIFEFFAQSGSTRSLYRQRLFHSKCVKATLEGADHRTPPPDVRKLNSVIFGAFSIPAEKLPGLMGPGAHLSYRLMQHCLYFAHVAVVYSLLVLIPVFLSQYFRHKGKKPQDLLKMMGVNYVSQSNPSHMWMIVISAYLMAYYWMLVIYSEWQHVKQVRLSWEHDSRSFHFQSHYSLLVEREAASKPVRVKGYLSKLLQRDEAEIPIVTPVLDPSKLWELEARRACAASLSCAGDHSVDELDIAIAAERAALKSRVEEGSDEKRKGRREAKPLKLGSADIDEELKPEVGGLTATTVKTTSTLLGAISRIFILYRPATYFVTLKSMSSRTILARMYGETQGGIGRLTPAPPACDLIWNNMTVEHKTIETRQYCVRILLFVFGVTYAIPIIKIQNLARDYNKRLLEDVDRVKEPSFASPQWNAEIMALYFPALLQILLSQMLPILFRAVSLYYERYKTFQEVTKFVTHRTFLFQLLTVYLFVFEEVWFDVTKVSGGLVVFVDSVVSRLRRLGQAIPPVSLYFASTVILNLVTEITVEIASPLMLIRSLYGRFILGNKNAWEDVGMVQFRYTSSMTTYLTLLNIMFTFGIIAPAVVFVCWIFWAVSYLWNTYAFIYLNNRKYEEATAFCATLYSGISTSLILSQFALFFLLWSLDSTVWNNHIQPQVYVSSALILLIFLFKYVVMHDFQVRASGATSLALAADIDLVNETHDVVEKFNHKYYYQPEIRDVTLPSTQSPLQTLNNETETKVFDLFNNEADQADTEKALLLAKNP